MYTCVNLSFKLQFVWRINIVMQKSALDLQQRSTNQTLCSKNTFLSNNSRRKRFQMFQKSIYTIHRTHKTRTSPTRHWVTIWHCHCRANVTAHITSSSARQYTQISNGNVYRMSFHKINSPQYYLYDGRLFSCYRRSDCLSAGGMCFRSQYRILSLKRK